MPAPILRWITACTFVAVSLSCSQTTIRGTRPREESRAIVEKLESAIAFEVQAKGLPALSIALIDDQQCVWAHGFGLARGFDDDDAPKVAATHETVYRAGSVSKLVTDILVMQLVDEGKLDLDKPVTTYLEDFRPNNPFGTEITLRQLMSHRSGLVREPPIGNYFDSSEPGLAATVTSMNKTRLVYAPTTRTKYSNAGLAVVGRIVEEVSGESFGAVAQRRFFDALGMTKSSFERKDVEDALADARMWSHHGSTFDAPRFQLGTSAAGNLYASVVDLGKFMSSLFAEDPKMLSRASLEAMWSPQFLPEGSQSGFGLGFFVSQHQGNRSVSHNGAVYGFATGFKALPDSKLGVACCASLDVANATVSRLTDYALDLLLAEKNGEALPDYVATQAIPKVEGESAEGLYRNGDEYARFDFRWEKLFLEERDLIREVRQDKDGWIVDDKHSYGQRVKLSKDGATLRVGSREYTKIADTKPPACPKRFEGLIGEYGWNDGEDPPGDHNVLYILEKGGRLYALIEWIFEYPLTEVSDGLFAFPDRGLYHGEKIRFEVNADGQGDRLYAAGVPFERRAVGTKNGETFRIEALHPSHELRDIALAASPPEQKSTRDAELVDLATVSSSMQFDIRYATTNNFLSTVFYEQPKAFLQAPAAKLLGEIHSAFESQGYGLLIHDAYRPWFVTKMFYDATPDSMRHFVANPARGSRHNRGCAIDLSLYHLDSGEPVDMGAGYDEFSERSYPDYRGGTSLQRWHRKLLRDAMESSGFTIYEYEWWHFDHKDWREYGLGNATFTELLES